MSLIKDAVYEPGDGKIHRGKVEIRAAFEPQFNGAWGVMRFDERDMVIDVENSKAASCWICRHDISRAKPRGLFLNLRRIITRLVVGDRFGWHSVDIFHFAENGKIKGKYSYGAFGSRPHIERSLG